MNTKTTRKLFYKLRKRLMHGYHANPPPPPPLPAPSPLPPRFAFFVLGGVFPTLGINAERDNSPPRAPDRPHKTCFWGTSF